MLRFLTLLPLLLAGDLPAQATDTLHVVVDSASMRMIISGSGPTVVLEAGASADSRTWSKVQAELSRFARVVSYDRLGYGGSERAKRPRTAEVMADQLREGLERAGVHPPFLLVSHSFGSIIARVFAARYPSEVTALVLVDPALESFYIRAAAEAPRAYLNQLQEDLAWADARASEAVRREYLGYETSLLQAKLAKLPKVPIVLLSAAKMELSSELRRIWLTEQANWAASTNAERIIVDHGHRIPQERPNIVVEAVRRLLK